MAAAAKPRRNPWADVWCRQCSRASRVGQWLARQDACPFCNAPASQRLSWALLRLYHPEWPLHPTLGATYLRRSTSKGAA